MKKNARVKRKSVYLKDSSQSKLIVQVYMIILLVMVVSGAVFYFIGNRNLGNEMFQAHSVIKTTMQLLLPALIGVNLIGLLGAVYLVFIFTHSIAGPVHRLKILSDKIAEGDLTVNVIFRKNDSIQQLSAVINKIIKGLNYRLSRVKNEAANLQSVLSEVKNIDKLSKEDLEAFKDKLLSLSAELDDELKNFKV